MPWLFPIGCLLLAACVPSRPLQKIPADTARILVEAPVRGLDPLVATDAVTQRVHNLIHGALVRYGPDMRLVPELAESWRIEGYRKFRLRLRPGLAFHDGSPLSAEEVRAAIERYRDPKSGSPHAVVLRHVREVRADGPLELEIRTDRPQPFLMNDLPALKIFKRAGPDIVGAGRFRPLTIGPREVALVRFDRFPEAPPPGAVRRVELQVVRDDTTRYQLLLRGDANVLLNGLSNSKTRYLKSHLPEGLAIHERSGVNMSYLAFNFRDPVLARLSVRRAIAHAIDADAIIRYRLSGFGTRATGILSPVHPDYEADVPRFDHDPVRAERLLDEAGFPRKSDGTRFSLAFKTTPDKTGLDMVRAIAGDLRRVGIDVRIQAVEQGTFFSDIRAGNFQLYISRWVGVLNPSLYFRVFHSSQIPERKDGGLNRGGYGNARMDQLLEKGMAEADDARRKLLFSAVQKLAAEDLPYVNLWYWNVTFIGTRDMDGLVLYPHGDYLTLAQMIRKPEPRP